MSFTVPPSKPGLCLTWLETLSTGFSHRAHVEHYTFSHGLHIKVNVSVLINFSQKTSVFT